MLFLVCITKQRPPLVRSSGRFSRQIVLSTVFRSPYISVINITPTSSFISQMHSTRLFYFGKRVLCVCSIFLPLLFRTNTKDFYLNNIPFFFFIFCCVRKTSKHIKYIFKLFNRPFYPIPAKALSSRTFSFVFTTFFCSWFGRSLIVYSTRCFILNGVFFLALLCRSVFLRSCGCVFFFVWKCISYCWRTRSTFTVENKTIKDISWTHKSSRSSKTIAIDLAMKEMWENGFIAVSC